MAQIHPLQLAEHSLCLCVRNVGHPTRNNERLFYAGRLYRFVRTYLDGFEHYAVGERFAHYKMKPAAARFRWVPPIIETWTYLDPDTFFESFELPCVLPGSPLLSQYSPDYLKTEMFDRLFVRHSLVSFPVPAFTNGKLELAAKCSRLPSRRRWSRLLDE